MLSHCTGSLEAESQQDVEADIKTQNPPRPTSSSEALPPEGPVSFLNNITNWGPSLQIHEPSQRSSHIQISTSLSAFAVMTLRQLTPTCS